MNTFLFAWNPKNWDWTTLDKSIIQIKDTGYTTEQWSVSSHKQIQVGDRAFLVKLGTEPKGVIASGFVKSPTFLSEHWDGSGRWINRVLIDFEVILHPDREPILSLDLLKVGELVNVNWTPRSSGVKINPKLTDDLEAIWFDFLITQKIKCNPFKETEKDDQEVYTEGTPNQVLVTKYERNPYARKTCIDHYGFTCSICKFNFKNKYGELGKDFIHVHHLKQVATVGKEYKIDPINDLRPVCPNCHAMIHRRKESYTIDEIKEKMNNASR